MTARARGIRSIVAAALLWLPPWTGAPGAFEDEIFVVTDPYAPGGNAAVLGPVAPWPATRDVEPVGANPVVRHFLGLHYVINRASGSVQVVDPATHDTILTFPVGPGSNPQDILVVDAHTAYVSRYESRWLYKVDPATGSGFDAVDLGPLADADGLPEMSMMARDGPHLFIQVQRIERHETYAPVPPSYLAVVDLSRDELLDLDPDKPGIQGIALTGTRPAFRMVVEENERRLYVSEPGQWLDGTGGIEAIDLETLRPLGFVTTEAQLGGADIGEFTMASRDKGYVNVHTDLVLTSHVSAFSRIDGSNLGQVFFGFGLVRGFAHDRVTRQLFLADPDSTPPGVHVLDTATDQELTATAIDTGRPPGDLVVTRDATPGEALHLKVEERDAQTGALTLVFGPGCGASNHDIVYGPLEAVRTYGYSGRVCGIGNVGRHAGFDPGPGSTFFLVVGTDGSGIEGSYGRNSAGNERPAQGGGTSCPATQDLSRRCD